MMTFVEIKVLYYAFITMDLNNANEIIIHLIYKLIHFHVWKLLIIVIMDHIILLLCSPFSASNSRYSNDELDEMYYKSYYCISIMYKLNAKTRIYKLVSDFCGRFRVNAHYGTIKCFPLTLKHIKTINIIHLDRKVCE